VWSIDSGLPLWTSSLRSDVWSGYKNRQAKHNRRSMLWIFRLSNEISNLCKCRIALRLASYVKSMLTPPSSYPLVGAVVERRRNLL
jgi:hypothetical protein